MRYTKTKTYKDPAQMKSSAKRNISITDFENEPRSMKKICSYPQSIKNSKFFKDIDFIHGGSLTQNKKVSKFEEKNCHGKNSRQSFSNVKAGSYILHALPVHENLKNLLGDKTNINILEFFSSDGEMIQTIDSVTKKEQNSDNLNSSFVSTDTEKMCNCKHCDHVSLTKSDYWEHLKIHIEENVRWNCPLCKFITAHKYHLMHHSRDHVGSIPSKSLKFVRSFLNKSAVSSRIKPLVEQLKLRNAKNRIDHRRLEILKYIEP